MINLENDMKIYDVMHKMEAHKNYFIIDEQQTKNVDLVQYIHNNYDKFDHGDLKQCLMKCITEKEMRRIILNYELQHYTTDPVDNMEFFDFCAKSKQIFDRYQGKAGGFHIEDEWNVHTYESEEHNVKNYEVMFENSIENYFVDDGETENYLFHIDRILNGLANNINVEIRFREDTKFKITWIYIWAINKNIKKKTPKISI